MQRRDYDFFVYIAASRSHQLYIGFTNGLARRMSEHREHRPGTYTAGYRIDRLVYYEHHQYVINAIAREKELKTWTRSEACFDQQHQSGVGGLIAALEGRTKANADRYAMTTKKQRQKLM